MSEKQGDLIARGEALWAALETATSRDAELALIAAALTPEPAQPGLDRLRDAVLVEIAYMEANHIDSLRAVGIRRRLLAALGSPPVAEAERRELDIPPVCTNCGKVWDLHVGPDSYCARYFGDTRKSSRWEPVLAAPVDATRHHALFGDWTTKPAPVDAAPRNRPDVEVEPFHGGDDGILQTVGVGQQEQLESEPQPRNVGSGGAAALPELQARSGPLEGPGRERGDREGVPVLQTCRGEELPVADAAQGERAPDGVHGRLSQPSFQAEKLSEGVSRAPDACEKCGGTDLRIHFTEKGDNDLVRMSSDPRRKNPPAGIKVYSEHHWEATEDVLRVHCQRCRWWWTRSPLPAEPPAQGVGGAERIAELEEALFHAEAALRGIASCLGPTEMRHTAIHAEDARKRAAVPIFDNWHRIADRVYATYNGLPALRAAPVEGEHHWLEPTKVIKWPHCGTCGTVKRADGGNKPCPGVVRVDLRAGKCSNCLGAGAVWLDETRTRPCPACHATGLAAPVEAETGGCAWTEDGDGNWTTGCGRMWVFAADGPTENDVRYCIGCGRHVEARPAGETGERE